MDHVGISTRKIHTSSVVPLVTFTSHDELLHLRDNGGEWRSLVEGAAARAAAVDAKRGDAGNEGGDDRERNHCDDEFDDGDEVCDENEVGDDETDDNEQRSGRYIVEWRRDSTSTIAEIRTKTPDINTQTHWNDVILFDLPKLFSNKTP